MKKKKKNRDMVLAFRGWGFLVRVFGSVNYEGRS